ncbi:MAG: hypothetical protein M3R38_04725, partial [Actinomycetota bacterium]|nr:hypothetical protein [Actinomycetota bacterium]
MKKISAHKTSRTPKSNDQAFARVQVGSGHEQGAPHRVLLRPLVHRAARGAALTINGSTPEALATVRPLAEEPKDHPQA